MIAEPTLLMAYGGSSEDVARTCHPHPVPTHLSSHTHADSPLLFTDIERSSQGGSHGHLWQVHPLL